VPFDPRRRPAVENGHALGGEAFAYRGELLPPREDAFS